MASKKWPDAKQNIKAKNLISEKNISSWDKKRAAFFATNPKCTECGGAIDHYSRTGVCRRCQIRIEKKKHEKDIKAYMKKYYKEHGKEIAERRKAKYQNKRW